jgi:hypothetical protein
MAEAFGKEAPPPHLRERADIATGEHIANQIPAGGAKREALLGEMLESIIAGAIATCSEAHDGWLEAAAAEEEMERARRAGNFASERLEERAAVLARGAAERLFIADMWSEEAEAFRERSALPGAVRPGGRETSVGRRRGVRLCGRRSLTCAQRGADSSARERGTGSLSVRLPILCPSDTVKRWCRTSSSGVGRAKRSTVGFGDTRPGKEGVEPKRRSRSSRRVAAEIEPR